MEMDVIAAGILQGVLLGLGAAVPIGPVNVQIARRALEDGFWAAVALGCGAVTVDVVYAVAAALGGRAVGDNPWVFWPVSVGGIGLLTWLGWMSIRGARADARRVMSSGSVQRGNSGRYMIGGYMTGLAMTATNPMTLAFWFVALPNTAMNLGGGTQNLPAICVGVFLGTIGWVLTFSGLMAGLGRWRKPWWLAAASEVGGVILLVFAALAFVRCAGRLV
jgi:threonine/homoserine/homoserine lactone efflux protein